MESGGPSPAPAPPRVKEEPECEHHSPPHRTMCMKLEAESNEEAEGLAEEPEHEPVCMKQELLWEDGGGLYVDHQVKKELVLGPESLQKSGIALLICGARAAAAAAAAAADTTSPARDTGDAAHEVNTDRNVVEINTYMCDICGQLFMQKKKLIRHIKRHLRGKLNKHTHTGEKALTCKICNKKFTQYGHLNRHRRIHSGAKPHSCEICKKEFTRLDSLRQHKIIHSGRRPYSCEVCGKEFTQLSNVTRHTRIHTGEKPYACEICLKRFAQSCDLKKHIRIHTGDKPYSCEICSRLFTCSGDLRTHKRTAGHRRVLLNRRKV